MDDPKPIDELTTDELRRLYYLSRLKHQIVEPSMLPTYDYLSNSEGQVRMSDKILPVVLINPNTTLPTGVSAYALTDPITVTGTTTGGDHTQTVTTGQIWEIWTIIAAIDSDATVAGRTWRIGVVDPPPLDVSGATRSLQTSVLTLTANQNGQIVMNRGPNHTTNDAGTVALVSGENPLPIWLSSTGTIVLENSAANTGAGDVAGLTVKYRRVG